MVSLQPMVEQGPGRRRPTASTHPNHCEDTPWLMQALCPLLHLMLWGTYLLKWTQRHFHSEAGLDDI